MANSDHVVCGISAASCGHRPPCCSFSSLKKEGVQQTSLGSTNYIYGSVY